MSWEFPLVLTVIVDHLTSYIFSFSDTPLNDIEDAFKKFVNRDDIDIILINQIVSFG